MSTTKLQDAIEEFGKAIVYEVQTIVDVSDADGAYALFGDMGMFEHQQCIEMIYFE